jgi:DNA-binding response OmpR family regulator
MSRRVPKKTILVIEDDKFISSMYTHKFMEAGFSVLTSYNGIDGVAAARQCLPDAILLDVLLPELNGLEVLKHLRAETKLSRVPIILLSNISNPDEAERGHSLGATDYLIKAYYTPSEIVQRVMAALH